MSTKQKRTSHRDKLERDVITRIPAEEDDGNKEYKLKLLDKSDRRMEQMATQMRFRMDEGTGECIYTLGVTDSGGVIGLTEEEYKESRAILGEVAAKNNYALTLLTEQKVDSTDEPRTMYEFLVREHNPTKYVDIKVACAGNVDAGKCTKIGTKIRMYSGLVKNVEDIKVGDFLMGDDGTPRKVLETTKGFGQMYKIIPTNGEPVTVNKNHILCFKAINCNHVYYEKNKERYVVKCFVYKNKLPYIKTVFFSFQQENMKFYRKEIEFYDTEKEAYEKACEYLESLENNPDSIKYEDVVELSLEQYVNLTKETQNALKLYRVGVDYPEKEVPFDAYMMGYWLGGGTQTIKEYDLNTEKHIPDVFKYNSRQVRLKALAGLIDSGGSLLENGAVYEFCITRKNERLMNDIVEVARSLGFASYSKHCITIYGQGVEEIPVLNLKKFKPRKSDKDVLLDSIKDITIEPDQEYFGFELDGNGRFLLEDFTVTHNSSLLGVLLSGQNDDGRGKARLNVFNFAHEVKSGRTSSIAQHILGFDEHGKIVNHDESLGRKKTWPDIVKNSSKIVTFFDLCGHEPYLKTTIMGLTSQFPDVALILVGANMGVTKMTKEHMFLCLTLGIPFAIVITKIDICVNRQNVLKDTVKSVKKLLKIPGVRRIPCDVKGHHDVMLAAKNIHSFSTVPMFYVSNVTGEGIPLVREFLNVFTKKPRNVVNENKVEYHVEQTFQVPGVGTVIGGQLVQGKIKLGDKLILGPNTNTYKTVQVKSIHVKRVSVEEADAGRYVCLALKKIDRNQIHRGNVIMSLADKPYRVWEFEAEISVLKSHSTTIKPGYEPVVHTCSIRQTARILSITDKICNRKGKAHDDDVLRTGDRAKVQFRFCYHPEYIKKDFRLLLAEGRVKVIGKVLGVTPEICKLE